MKIIDLLNKIANGEEVPKKIKITNIGDRITRKYNFFYDEDDQEYKDDELFPLGVRLILDRVLNDKVEIIEEEKKIPEKLDVIGWDKCIHNVTHKEKELAIEINKTQKLLNQVIDYLKSKGDEINE